MVDECDQTSMTTTCCTASMSGENATDYTHASVSSLSSDSGAPDSDSGTFMLLIFFINCIQFFSIWWILTPYQIYLIFHHHLSKVCSFANTGMLHTQS